MNKKYGMYGGQFVSEQLMVPLKALEKAFLECMSDLSFLQEYQELMKNYIGRETPLYHAKNLTNHCGGGQIYLKREDLNHTGAHKINNAIGQALVAKCMGKTHIIAETGAGQHGVATATACALLNMSCTVFMGAEDIQRQAPNVAKMKLLGATIQPVTSGSSVLKDATNEAIRYWIEHVETCHYIIGSAIGPYPYPAIVRHFQSVIGLETKRQFQALHGDLPECIIACVGGGSNAIGMFSHFLDEDVRLIGVEAGGKGIDTPHHAATLTKGQPGILHGSLMYLLQEKGNIREVYSLSAGLDYPGIGPEHCHLKDLGRVEYTSITDQEAVDAFHLLSQKEGIIPALESSHALAEALKVAKTMTNQERLIICLSGRGDKDLNTILGQED